MIYLPYKSNNKSPVPVHTTAVPDSNSEPIVLRKMVLNNKILAKVALAGGVIALGSATFFNWKIQSNLKKSDYFQMAVKALVESPASAALGPPIFIGT